MAGRLVRSALALIFLAWAASTAAAQGSLLQELYGQGVHAFFLGEHEKAHDLFTTAIEQGTRDPRVYYFRGFVYSRTGRPEQAQEDFEKGAELEAAGEGFQIDIGAALQRVQGPVRLELENLRYQARLQAQLLEARQREERYEALRRDEERVLRDPTLREDAELPAAPDDVDDPFAADDRPAVPPADVDEEPFAPGGPEVEAADDPFADPEEPVVVPSPDDDDMFDAPAAEPADDLPVDDDPFGAPVDDDPFGPLDAADDDDLFDVPAADPADDDLFDVPAADPADDDLFDVPAADPADDLPVDDDPFGAPVDDDPFGAPEAADDGPFDALPAEPGDAPPAEEAPFDAAPGDEPMDDLFGDTPDPEPPAAPGGTLFDDPEPEPLPDEPIGGAGAAVGGFDASGAGAPPPEDGPLPGDTVPAHGEPPAPAIDPALPPGGLPPVPDEPAPGADPEAPAEPIDDPFGQFDAVDAGDDGLDTPLPEGAGDTEEMEFAPEAPADQEDFGADPFGDAGAQPELSTDDNDLFGGDEDPFANPPASELGDALPTDQADPFADDNPGVQDPGEDF